MYITNASLFSLMAQSRCVPTAYTVQPHLTDNRGSCIDICHAVAKQSAQRMGARPVQPKNQDQHIVAYVMGVHGYQ